MAQQGWETGDGAAVAAVTICGACEDLLGRVGAPWPGEAGQALERLRARIEELLAVPDPAPPSPPSAPPPLEVRALGATRIRAGGRDIDPPRRSRLVLQYLVAHRARPVGRDVLMEAFWPGSSPAAARNSLNVAVTLLRRALRPAYGDHPVVVFRDEAYGIDPAVEVRVDREEFERLARRGAASRRAGDHAGAARLLAGARAVYGGPLYADEPYEDWIAAQRRALEADHLAVLTALGASLAELGARDEAVEVLRSVLAAEPEREDVHRMLMEVHAADGRGYLALRQFDACRDALRRRLGVEPAPETRQVRDRILGRGGTAGTARTRAVIAA